MVSTKKLILVTGGRGMLGSSVQKVFGKKNLIIADHSSLDVRDVNQVLAFANKKIDLILHLAAETDLLAVEIDPEKAYLTNHTGTQNMVELARLLNIPIIYVSTAMIFDGQKRSYTENSKANPTNHYGRSKYYGELAVKSYKKYYIVRSGWAFGGGPELDKKFINKIWKQINLGAKKLWGIKDVYGNPTYTLDFAKTLKNIVDTKPPYGIYNAPGKNVASRYEFLKEFVDALGLSNKLEVIPVSLKEYLSLFPVSFPVIKNEVLSISKLEKTRLSSMRDWRTSLREYSKEFRK